MDYKKLSKISDSSEFTDVQQAIQFAYQFLKSPEQSVELKLDDKKAKLSFPYENNDIIKVVIEPSKEKMFDVNDYQDYQDLYDDIEVFVKSGKINDSKKMHKVRDSVGDRRKPFEVYKSGEIYEGNGIKGRVVEASGNTIKVEYTDEDGDIQTKNIDLTEIKDDVEEAKKGCKYKCIKTKRYPSGYGSAFEEGKEYEVSEDGYLVDESGKPRRVHYWELEEYFEEVKDGCHGRKKVKDSREDEVKKAVLQLSEANVLDEWDEEDVDYAIGDIFDGGVAIARISDLEAAYLLKTEFAESAISDLLNEYINFGELDDEEKNFVENQIKTGITDAPFHVIEELYDDDPEGMGFEIKVIPYDSIVDAWKGYSWGVD